MYGIFKKKKEKNIEKVRLQCRLGKNKIVYIFHQLKCLLCLGRFLRIIPTKLLISKCKIATKTSVFFSRQSLLSSSSRHFLYWRMPDVSKWTHKFCCRAQYNKKHNTRVIGNLHVVWQIFQMKNLHFVNHMKWSRFYT